MVAALTNETRTTDAQAWLQAQPPGEIAISEWGITEFSSALSLKLRVGTITVDQRATALAAFRRLTDRSLRVLTVTSSMFRMAAGFADQRGLAVRAGDALHLAAAHEQGLTLWTLDLRMANAGPGLGVATRLL
jgi:predicted nucleic acid-binding protein